jgi:hypothetical protein
LGVVALSSFHANAQQRVTSLQQELAAEVGLEIDVEVVAASLAIEVGHVGWRFLSFAPG